jgi:hypothetical protein
LYTLCVPLLTSTNSKPPHEVSAVHAVSHATTTPFAEGAPVRCGVDAGYSGARLTLVTLEHSGARLALVPPNRFRRTGAALRLRRLLRVAVVLLEHPPVDPARRPHGRHLQPALRGVRGRGRGCPRRCGGALPAVRVPARGVVGPQLRHGLRQRDLAAGELEGVAEDEGDLGAVERAEVVRAGGPVHGRRRLVHEVVEEDRVARLGR